MTDSHPADAATPVRDALDNNDDGEAFAYVRDRLADLDAARAALPTEDADATH